MGICSKANGSTNQLLKDYFRNLSSRHRSSKNAYLGHRNSPQHLQISSGYKSFGIGETLMERKILGTEDIAYEESTCMTPVRNCAKRNDIDKCAEPHVGILKKGLLINNLHPTSSLVNMGSKRGSFSRGPSVHNVIYWNALISGYVQQGKSFKALDCFRQMQSEGNSPNAVTFICALKACGGARDIENGKTIHEEIMNRGWLEKDVVLGTALVDMYVKCHALKIAREVLKGLPIRDVISWNAIIAGYAKYGQYHEALECFDEMQAEGLHPNVVTFICILKACGNLGAVDLGKKIHGNILDRGLLWKDIVLGNALVDMYAKCGFLVKAQEILKELPNRDVVSWNILISGYVHRGRGQEALDCFGQMQNEKIFPDVITYISALQACSTAGTIREGVQIHEEIVARGLLEKDVLLGTTLVDMYAKHGMLWKARNVLEEMPLRNEITWNVLIGGYAQQGQCIAALDCFSQMQREGLSPDVSTFISLLKACSSVRAVDKGIEIHLEIVKRGLLNVDAVLATTLLDMYAKCGMLDMARKMLGELHVRSIFSWSALIAGYIQQGRGSDALVFYERIRAEGLSPDAVTYICVLKACSGTGAIDKGKQIHEEIVNRGLLQDVVLGNVLIDMYAKCGMIREARKVLQGLPTRDVVSWSSLIAGCAEQEFGHQVLDCFREMQNDGLSPNAVTFICVLKACGNVGAIDIGKQIHDDIVSRGLLNKNVMLATALVDMYANCGMLMRAQEVLEKLPFRDVVTWNALIAGYAHVGQGHVALNCLERMQREGLCPDEITFLCVISACCHSGLWEEAQFLFQTMDNKFGIPPNAEHHSSMVVGFGYAGHFNKAASIANLVAYSDHLTVWLALLSASRKWGNVKLGRLAFNEVLQRDGSCTSAYVLMADIFAAAGMHDDAQKVENMGANYSKMLQMKPTKHACNELVDHN